jgi:hypothetical protein
MTGERATPRRATHRACGKEAPTLAIRPILQIRAATATRALPPAPTQGRGPAVRPKGEPQANRPDDSISDTGGTVFSLRSNGRPNPGGGAVRAAGLCCRHDRGAAVHADGHGRLGPGSRRGRRRQAAPRSLPCVHTRLREPSVRRWPSRVHVRSQLQQRVLWSERDRVAFIAKARDATPSSTRKRSSIWFSGVP